MAAGSAAPDPSDAPKAPSGDASGASAAAAVAAEEDAAEEDPAEAAREVEEMELVYLQYRALAARMRPWIGEILKRQDGSADNAAVLGDVRAAYWRSRRHVAGSALRASLSRVSADECGQDEGGNLLSGLVRGCCSQANRACRAEHSLYLAFFAPPADAAADAAADGKEPAQPPAAAAWRQRYAHFSPQRSNRSANRSTTSCGRRCSPRASCPYCAKLCSSCAMRC